MFATIAQATVSLVMLYFGGEALVRGASTVASRIGVSSLAIGLTVVAFGTSAPELVVSLDAALSGANDVSVGNVVGSNIANITLIAGLAALIRPSVVEAKLVRVDAPIMIAVSLALAAVLANGTASLGCKGCPRTSVNDVPGPYRSLPNKPLQPTAPCSSVIDPW